MAKNNKQRVDLSQADLDMIPKVRDEWINIGLATGRADREKVNKAVREAYEVAGLTPPKTIEWFDSPIAGYRRIIEINPDYRNTTTNIIFGQHDADWLSFYDFFSRCESVKIPEIEKLRPVMTIAKEAGWWWPFDDVCIMTERPVEVHLDASGRLHAENGMAMRYADDWGFCSWHGYRIPKDFNWIIFEKEKLTPEDVEKQPNAELRRVMLEIMGFEKYLSERKAKVISEDTDGVGNPRRLLEIQVNNEAIRVVEVINSSPEPDGTFKKYHLGAMRGDTPHDVISASFGFNPDTFKEEVAS